MKQLRVLTGRHAGAQISLSASEYRIAADEQADIQIVDWQGDALFIELKDEDHMVAFALGAPHTAQSSTDLRGVFEDFVPRRFLDVVLCIGGHDAAWPSDMELMERLMRPAAPVVVAEPLPAPAAAPRRMWPMASACIAASLALVGVFAAVVSRNVEAAKVHKTPEPLLAQVWRVVSSGSFPGITARPVGDRVIVEGLLADSAEVTALQQALARFPADRVDHRYAAADDVAQSISDALPVRGLSVTYRGNGVFVVGGSVPDTQKLAEAARRVTADLAPLVQSIEVAASETPAPDRVPVGAMLTTDGLEYVQTRDGVKHLTLTPQAVTELTDPPAELSR